MADTKPKARGARPPTSVPPEPAKDTRPQRERFIEAATEAGVTDETLEKAVAKIAPPKGSGKSR